MLYFDTITGGSYSGLAYLNDLESGKGYPVQKGAHIEVIGPVSIDSTVWKVSVLFNGTRFQHRVNYTDGTSADAASDQFNQIFFRCFSVKPLNRA